MKKLLTRFAASLEDLYDKVKDPGTHFKPRLEPYIGYATPDSVVLRGRVLALKPEAAAKDKTPSRWDNIRSMAGLFNTHEMEGVTVRVGGVEVVSDEEGYVSLEVARPKNVEGWRNFSARLEDADEDSLLPALLPSAKARFGIISDIDDTMMLTNAYSLRRNILTTLTGNTESRHIFPDAVKLMDQLHNGVNPVFYVSSSPWNLHGFLESVFAHNGLLPGPKFLRDFGLDRDRFIKNSHGDHKGDAIDTILAANPDLPFTLIGDTGQHDAAVYRDAINRHGTRVERVILRQAGPVLDEEDERHIAALRATDARIDIVQDYTSLL